MKRHTLQFLWDNGLVFDNPDIHVKFPFSIMTKKFGRPFLDIMEASYLCNVPEWLGTSPLWTENEFSKAYGDVPESYLQKLREMVSCHTARWSVKPEMLGVIIIDEIKEK